MVSDGSGASVRYAVTGSVVAPGSVHATTRNMSLVSRSVAVFLASCVLASVACGDDGGDVEAARNPGTTDPPASNPGPTPEADGGGTTPVLPAHGFRADYFDVFSDKKTTRGESKIAIEHDDTTSPGVPGIRGFLYSARFTATLKVETAGEHTFIATADDGVRVFVDDKAIVDVWKVQAPTEVTGKATLEPGDHALRIEYFQGRGGAKLAFEWQPPGGARGAIPEAQLTPLADPPKDDKGKELPGPRPTFSNPVVGFDCPDPGVIGITRDGHPLFAMVCTGGSFPIRLSDDLVTWRDAKAAVIPGGKTAWSANGGRNWAPEIHAVGAGFVAYYTAVNGANRLSIGCAHAPALEGPYTDCGGPLVEHPQGVIDANFFKDTDGKQYLYYKIDGNSVGQRTPIFVRELAADGRSFAPGSQQVEVLNNDANTWEGGVVEASWVFKHGADYFMFYSGNVYDNRYRTGVARAKSPKGPFTKKGAPIMNNNAQWVGPGHGTVLSVHGRDYFFHHAWPALPNGAHDTSKGRFGLIAPISWGADGWPSVGGSSVADPMLWP